MVDKKQIMVCCEDCGKVFPEFEIVLNAENDDAERCPYCGGSNIVNAADSDCAR